MFRVTTAALNRLSSKLAGKKASLDEAFRFTRRSGGWRLRLDRPRSEDMEFTNDGRRVLLLDAAASQAMTNKMLDVRSTESGPRLRLRKRPGDHDET